MNNTPSCALTWWPALHQAVFQRLYRGEGREAEGADVSVRVPEPDLQHLAHTGLHREETGVHVSDIQGPSCCPDALSAFCRTKVLGTGVGPEGGPEPGESGYTRLPCPRDYPADDGGS